MRVKSYSIRTPLRQGWALALSVLLLLALTGVFAQAQEETPPAEGSGMEGSGTEGTGAEAAPANELGQQVYSDECARCHGDDGQAGTRIAERFGINPFTIDGLGTLGEAGISAAVTEGRENMPAKTDLSEEQLAALSAYVMTLGL